MRRLRRALHIPTITAPILAAAALAAATLTAALTATALTAALIAVALTAALIAVALATAALATTLAAASLATTEAAATCQGAGIFERGPGRPPRELDAAGGVTCILLFSLSALTCAGAEDL